jgi:hypothetical protein
MVVEVKVIMMLEIIGWKEKLTNNIEYLMV